MSAPHDGHDDFVSYEEAVKIDSERTKEIHENVLACFESPQGEFVLAWLYDSLRMGRSTFIRGAPDQSAYLEGRRSVLLEIMSYLRLDDDELHRRARRVSRRIERTRHE